MKKIVVIGGGPAGLYFSLLAKKALPQASVEVYEQNPEGATYGFGVMLDANGLNNLERADTESANALRAAMYFTRHQLIRHRGEEIFVEQKRYAGAISRLRLLDVLQQQCRRRGVQVYHQRPVDDVSLFASADLVVGADGANSSVRRSGEAEFKVERDVVHNRLAWMGSNKHFAYPMLSFKRHGGGHFLMVAYPYTESLSTVVIECDEAGWRHAGVGELAGDEARAEFAEQLFSEELGGCKLFTNKSAWRQLPVVRCQRWHSGNCVLIGDALHSAHPSIGSGTRIAMEDAIALASAVAAAPDVEAACRQFRSQREPGKQTFLAAMNKSIAWYEDFGEHMDRHGPVDFVFDYLLRTGRLSVDRLKQEYPRFMQNYYHRWNDKKAAEV